MIDNDREHEALESALALSVRIDETIRLAATPSVLTVPAVNVPGIGAVPAPGLSRLVEDLWLSRRTFSTVHFLMLHTHRAGTAAGDFTEDAAVLVRRLVELLAQISWLTDYDPPDGSMFQASLGSMPVRDGDDSHPIGDPTERSLFEAHLAAAVSWIDAQALRSDLKELRQERLTVGALVKSAGASGRDTTEHDNALLAITAKTEMTEERLKLIGAPASPREGTIDVLARLGPNYVLSYRYESDVAHGMRIGRGHQRGGPAEPMLGATSSRWRRKMMVDAANAITLELGERALATLGGSTDELTQLAHKMREKNE